jgi:tRNA uridine 5-carboxymethylaminomethyl modification enzyme
VKQRPRWRRRAVGPDTLFVESVVEQVETMAKYSGYIDRQRDEIDRVAHFET